MDLKTAYDAIADAADRAVKSTAVLKEVSGTLLHGALGPGLMLMDPIDQFVKGEATFAKASKSFVEDAKHFELGGKAIGSGFKLISDPMDNFMSKQGPRLQKYVLEFGKTFQEAFGASFQNANSAIVKFGTNLGNIRFEKWGEGIKTFTSTSVMMSDTIEALATKTGILATSFRGLAQVIKVATGPIATAFMATSFAYDTFVKKWMEDSAKLENSVKSTASLFGGDAFGVRSVMGQAGRQGVSREAFLGQMGQAGIYGKGLGTGATANIAEIARIVAEQTGKAQTDQMKLLVEHFATRQMMGATDLQKEILQQRVIAGGPRAGIQLKGVGERYGEWSEGIGRSLNIMAQGNRPSDIYRSITFPMVGNTMENLGGSLIQAANNFQPLNLLKYSPQAQWVGPAQQVLPVAGKLMQGLDIGYTRWAGQRDLATAAQLGSNPLASERERGRRLGIMGTQNTLLALQKELQYRQPELEEQAAGLREKVGNYEQVKEAMSMRDQMNAAGPGIESQVLRLAHRMQGAAQSGDTEKLTKLTEEAQKVATQTGKSFNDLLKAAQVVDNFIKEFPEPKDMEKFMKEGEANKEKLSKIEKQGAAEQKTIGMLQGITGQTEPQMSYQQIMSAPAAENEKKEIEFYKAQAQKQARIRELSQTTGLDKTRKDELARLRDEVATPGLAQKYQELQATGDEKGANKLLKNANPDVAKQVTQILAVQAAIATQQQKLIQEQHESNINIAQTTLPAQIQMARARGIVGNKEAANIRQIGAGGIGSIEAGRMQIQLQEAEATQQAMLMRDQARFMGPQRIIQGQMLGLQARSMGVRGELNEGEQGKIDQALVEAERRRRHGQPHADVYQQRAELMTQTAQMRTQAGMARTSALYEPRQFELQKQGIGAQIAEMSQAGVMNEKDVEKVQNLLAKGRSEELHHVQTILQVTQQRAQIEEKILQTKMQGIQREGSQVQIGLQMASMERRGFSGMNQGAIESKLMRRKGLSLDETATNEINTAMQSPRAFDAGQGVIKNILQTREQMYQQELQFTIQYTQMQMRIVATHYENLNNLARTKLESADRKYAPHVQYGQEIAGTMQTIASAQMGRYAGEDYRREQGRQYQDMVAGFAGVGVPRAVQIARQMGDFRRARARQRESDTLGLQGMAGTLGAVQNAVTQGGGNMAEFDQSEGGRNLRLQLLQQNQAAFSRRGIDVSGQIGTLAREQQKQAGLRLVTEMGIRGNKTKAIEEQIAIQERNIGGLKPGSQQNQAQGELAETYGKAAEHYMQIGDQGKAQEYVKKQEEAMAKLPDELKKNFGDSQKQSLSELQTHTKLLTEINKALGGKPTEETAGAAANTDTGIPESPDATGGAIGEKGKGGNTANKFGEYVEKFGKIIEKPIQITLNGQQAATTGGGAGAY